MSLRFVNLIALSAALLVGVTFTIGALSAPNAFFFGLAIVTLYVGYQLSLRDGEPLTETLAALVARPSTHPRRAAYFAYVGTLCVAGLVMLESVAVAF